MRDFILYIDESGIASLTDHTNDFFIMTGMIVELSVDKEISAYFNFIKRRYEFSNDTSLHAYDLFEDKKTPQYLAETNKCKEFTESVSEYIENVPVKIFVFSISKKELRKKLGIPDGYAFKGEQKHKSDKEIAYEILARKLFFTFAKFLKKEKAIGSVVAESRRNADVILLRAYLDSQDIQIFQKIPEMKRAAELAKKHIHSICFAGKGSLKGGLELADMISYCAFNELIEKFPKKRNDSRGIKAMWTRIKKQIQSSGIVQVTKRQITSVGSDRIHKTSERAQKRLKEFRDLVNPTIK